MANMRIHELAKEINVPNKEIIEVLKKNNRENLTHMSNVSDSEISAIKKELKGTGKPQSVSERPATEAVRKPQSAPAQAASAQATQGEKSEASAEAKKSHITQVYNPQNSSRARDGQSGQGGYNRDRNQQGSQGQGGYNRDRNQQGGQGGYNRDRSQQGGQGQSGQSGYSGGYNRDRSQQGGQGQGGQGGYSGGYNRDRSQQGGQGQSGQGGYSGGYNRDRSQQGGQGGYSGGYNRDRNQQGGQGQSGQGGYSGGYNRDRNQQGGQGQGGQGGQGGYSGGYNRGPAGQGGQGGYNRDRNQQGGQGSQGGYNRGPAGQGGQGGQGGYNRGGQGGQGGQGGYNRDRSQQGGQGGYNRGGQGGQGGQGGYNRGGQGGQGGQGGYNRGGQGQGGQGGYNRGGQAGSRTESTEEKFVIATKPESRRADYKGKVDKKPQKDRDVKENLKFVNTAKKQIIPQKPVEKEDTIKTLVLPDILTIKELAEKMKIVPSAVVKKLFLQGKVVTINQEVDYDTAEEIALEFNCVCEHEIKIDVIAELLKEDDEDQELLVPRSPVVCVMGHVDHGKTSLLDAIRSTRVTAKESGGITQKIGAYTVEINNQKITFLDTPGHEAFTAMRMRGAKATDIAILVVAADDGVMPQTVEAISHAKAANIDIIVAINKVDKPNANIERVKQELTEYELVPEEWGGETIFVPVSAHTKEGIDTLLEMILLTAEMRELKANPDRKARGIVIEAQLDKGKGPVASILVQKGTLKVGDNIAAGSCYGKIRAMTDDKGHKVKEAGPSMPVEILGLNDVPNAGEIIVATDNEKEARSFAETFIREGREKLLDDTKAKLSLDDLFTQIKAGNVKELGIIIKADVQGSVEAIKASLLKLSNDEVAVKIVHGGVGNINESDVSLASASNAIIIGFNVKPDNQARIVADREKVDLRLYKVIYNAIEDVEAALKGMLEPIFEEKVTGHAEIRQIFKASGIGNIAGSYVTDGKISKNSKIRIKRDGEQIFEGNLASLKRYKDEVKEVKEGYECGFVFEKFNDIKELDVVEAYEMVEVPRK